MTGIALEKHGISRRALLWTLPLLLVLGVRPVLAQHEGGKSMPQHDVHTMAPDSTSRMRESVAERRTWLGVRLGFIVAALALFFVWWRYQLVLERRAMLAKEERSTASPPGAQPRRLPRQRRRW